MKKKYLVMTIIGLFLLVGSLIMTQSSLEKENNKENIVPKGRMLSLMVEQTAGAGDYKPVTQSNWPTDGYKYNAELSGCENDGKLMWDDEEKKVILQGNVSDKCYVYFDIYEEKVLLSDYVISQYTGTQGENGIYYHNAGLTNGAKDDSYRYAGANPNNYVCFGSNDSTCPNDNLYRIVSVKDGKVKLIKSDYANSNLLGTDGDYANSGNPNATYYKGNLTTINTYYWNNNADTSNYNNTWSTSLLNKTNLNTNFINNIGSEWAKKIAVTTWKVGGNTYANIYSVTPTVAYQNEIVNPVTTNSTDNAKEYDAKIGLMYVSDYGFAASPSAWTLTMSKYNNTTATSNNWMYMGAFEWTLTRIVDSSINVFYLAVTGLVDNDLVNLGDGIRPVFNLEDSVAYKSGSGTSSDPIRIN